MKIYSEIVNHHLKFSHSWNLGCIFTFYPFIIPAGDSFMLIISSYLRSHRSLNYWIRRSHQCFLVNGRLTASISSFVLVVYQSFWDVYFHIFHSFQSLFLLFISIGFRLIVYHPFLRWRRCWNRCFTVAVGRAERATTRHRRFGRTSRFDCLFLLIYSSFIGCRRRFPQYLWH